MGFTVGPRRQQLLAAWKEVGRSHPTGRGYDLTPPTRSEQFAERLVDFIESPDPGTFETMWQPEVLVAAEEWYVDTVRNLWSGSLEDLAAFLDTIRQADAYDEDWEVRLGWGSGILHEVYSRTHPAEPIVSPDARKGLKKFGVNPGSDYAGCREQIESFHDLYERRVGRVSAADRDSIPVREEIDQLFRLVTSIDMETIRAEAAGPRGKLYTALQGYPADASKDRGPIDIDFEAATPAIDGYIAGRKEDAYKDHETEHWAGTHYEWWKWDFADYVTTTVEDAYDVTDLDSEEVEGFLEAFWANSDEYTDTGELSTPVPRYLLGRWGVRQFADFEQHCLDNPDEAATVLSHLLDEEQHLVGRLERFHDFGQPPEISDGNLLRVATTLLMGFYPDEYINFQYERFDTFFSDCSSVESLETGFDARQYYRIVLACRDLRDMLRKELPDANMLDVHTLIRLYQDYAEQG